MRSWRWDWGRELPVEEEDDGENAATAAQETQVSLEDDYEGPRRSVVEQSFTGEAGW